MANTVIQLKYSTINANPSTLNVGEPAYSFTSDKLFIGNAATGVLTIGGKRYVDLIEANTSAATPGTIVTRDTQGSASFNVITANSFVGPIDGNAATASKWLTPIDLGLSGDATGNVSVDGSSNVTLQVELTNTGVTAGNYGGASNIAVFTVDEDGRITSAANASISTTLTVQGDTDGTFIDLLSETLHLYGGDGITTTANDSLNSVTFGVDNTVIRTTGDQAITGNLAITGNFFVAGNTITLDTETLRVNDSILLLAANNDSGDILDIGMAAHYGVGGNNHTGLIRHAADGKWYLFENYTDHFIHDLNTINIADPTFVTANLVANLVGGKISGLTEVIALADGGTGAASFTTGNLIVSNGTSLVSIANTGTAGTYANASHIPVITTDEYGRVSGVVNTKIDIDASQVTTGTLPIARGGTNAGSFASNGLVRFDGISLVALANSTYTQTGTFATSNTVTSITVDDFGRLTALTSASIAIDTSQVTSGTLGVERGGTGAGTFTTNGVLLGQGTSAFTTVSSSTEGHILTINNAGVPTFEMLSGGTF
jgi:hypothetical protein